VKPRAFPKANLKFLRFLTMEQETSMSNLNAIIGTEGVDRILQYAPSREHGGRVRNAVADSSRAQNANQVIQGLNKLIGEIVPSALAGNSSSSNTINLVA
jgi:hypothetical protein